MCARDLEALADAGLTAGIELRTPSVARGAYRINAFFFTDHGIGITQLPLPGQPARVHLDSIGGGLKLAVGTEFDAAIDWALGRTRTSRTIVNNDPRVDFLVKYSF